MKALTGISLILVILLVSLSAYLRLAHSGIGCADWPACYGRIGDPPAEVKLPATSEEAYQRLVDQSSLPLSWATPLHRLVASVLGLLIIFLNVVAVRQKRFQVISVVLLALTVSLAVLGIRSGSLHDPAIVMANLAGGFAMLGLLGWLWFCQSDRVPDYSNRELPSAIIVIGIALLSAQILAGGLTSANFAATSCRTLPDCHGTWWPGKDLLKAMDLSRNHEVTASGQAIGGPERIAIHQAHRLGALLTASLLLLISVAAIRKGGAWRITGLVIAGLVIMEFSAGIASVLAGLPIVLAVAHNWLAALLLLSLIRLLTLQRLSKR